MPVTTPTNFFRRITPGIETVQSTFSLPRHRHMHAYASVVVAGSFVESGYIGRIHATEGDVLIHPELDCHANRRVSAGLRLIRLDWSHRKPSSGFYRLGNELDDLAKTAEKDPRDAAQLLEDALHQNQPSPGGVKDDWPDLLAEALTQDSSLAIGEWAHSNHLAQQTVSRGFSAVYGVAPEVFRAEARARTAWLRVTHGSDCLCQIAAESGFADQAHMTRWIHRITGAPPGAWRNMCARSLTGPRINAASATTSSDDSKPAAQRRPGRFR
ncbi:MAG TPA: helix-turn-helix domain-containing protein [Terriglobales bacterium]|nr:helix-turn-helix domain-containing protein [Terriglobales bacterium]